MPELNELYQEVILDHSKNPKNFFKLKHADRMADGFNPLCGDKITVYLKLENNAIKDISFQGSGCALSKASASMMTESLKNKNRAEIDSIFQKFHKMVTGSQNGSFDPSELGKLAAFSGVKEFPVRVKCATLAWHTLLAALDNKKDQVTTE